MVGPNPGSQIWDRPVDTVYCVRCRVGGILYDDCMFLLWLTVIPLLSEGPSLQRGRLTSESNLIDQWKIRGPSYSAFLAGCYASLEAITTSIEEVL